MAEENEVEPEEAPALAEQGSDTEKQTSRRSSKQIESGLGINDTIEEGEENENEDAEGQELSEDALALKEELDKITVEPPPPPPP